MHSTDTSTINASPINASPIPRPSPRFGWSSSIGRHRTTNEDAVLIGPAWFAIADGMGGHRAGDVASTLVVDVLSGFAALAPSTDPHTIDTLIGRAITRANTIIQRAATGPRTGMGTTVVGTVLLDDGSAAVFHVGDSRCYQINDGTLVLLTTDHTHVRELVDAGRLPVERAHGHPMRHVLTRAIGIGHDVSPELRYVVAPLGRLMLCSDGVSAHLDDPTMRHILTSIGDPGHAADALVRAAIDAGSHDDATAIVVDPWTPDLG